ncbi:hypothetical protein [Paenibacillus sp.]|uniref:hypothetical protein n=1 Tax=Paenibacillus sp. TaxID=58172 RepID=UPI002D5EC7CC|nr:hypothetical protein [Paenibacillus sp.]HZG55937.1 hypothetical protein [Paenibacillus sp.]
MAGKPIKDGEDDQLMNNRPPELKNDFGIVGEEDKLDRELMPDGSGSPKQRK